MDDTWKKRYQEIWHNIASCALINACIYYATSFKILTIRFFILFKVKKSDTFHLEKWNMKRNHESHMTINKEKDGKFGYDGIRLCCTCPFCSKMRRGWLETYQEVEWTNDDEKKHVKFLNKLNKLENADNFLVGGGDFLKLIIMINIQKKVSEGADTRQRSSSNKITFVIAEKKKQDVSSCLQTKSQLKLCTHSKWLGRFVWRKAISPSSFLYPTLTLMASIK